MGQGVVPPVEDQQPLQRDISMAAASVSDISMGAAAPSLGASDMGLDSIAPSDFNALLGNAPTTDMDRQLSVDGLPPMENMGYDQVIFIEIQKFFIVQF